MLFSTVRHACSAELQSNLQAREVAAEPGQSLSTDARCEVVRFEEFGAAVLKKVAAGDPGRLGRQREVASFSEPAVV